MIGETKKKITRPYGSWQSPISARLVGSGNHVFELKFLDDEVFFVEVRPTEKAARYSIMKISSRGGEASEITPPPFNARTRVHEYGGGAFILAKGSVYFSNYSDQRLYRIESESSTVDPITPEGVDSRYADGIFDSHRNRIICVREHHPIPEKRDAVNCIVAIDDTSYEERVIVSGNDFYSFPRLSADGSKMAWVTWNFPNMPFDGSELWVGEFDSEGSLKNKAKIAGGFDESVTQPRWSSTGELYFISDRTGWWNIYRWAGKNISALCPKSADFCEPDWNLGLSSYALGSDDLIVCTFSKNGIWKLATLRTKSLELDVIDTPLTEIRQLHACNGHAVFLGGSPAESVSILRLDISSRKIEKVYESPGDSIDQSFYSPPLTVQFPTANDASASGFYYEPLNPGYQAPQLELPPLVVMVHGGPTSATTNSNKGKILFFTSRGFAVLDVNYGGSSGFGREYRRRLNGQWGIVDVEDCVNGAVYLAQRRKIDKDKIVIRGGSAGGWTTLCALAFTKNVFKAGACLYGISDLEHWELEAHKFEAQYLHSLIGSYAQERELFLERSPTTHIEDISAPLIVFQGLEDKVVPPNQSEMVVRALRRKRADVEYMAFEGEQHDFRQAHTIEKQLEAELAFYLKALGIDDT